MIDEGYIKFEAHWTPAPSLPLKDLHNLLHWRQHLYHLGLIGAYANGVGYGNISTRYHGQQFVITGSGTGNFPQLTPQHFTLVTQVDAPQNQCWCQGPIVASSESMSHAAIYANSPSANSVIHVHHLGLWQALLGKEPTTPASVSYGTPEMAAAITQLFSASNLPQRRIFVMEGHREGIFVFGESLTEAGELLLRYYKELQPYDGDNR
ncbi:MAG: class II aldolase/adducin family protein [Bacteroidota bacterium]